MHSHTEVMPMSDIEESSYLDSKILCRTQTASLKSDGGVTRKDLSLSNPILFQQYKSSQKRNFDLVAIIPLLATFYVGVATRSNLQNSFNLKARGGPLFFTAFIMLFVGSLVFLTYFCSHLLIYKTPKDTKGGYYYRKCERYLKYSFRGRIEDVVAALGVSSIGFYLTARVVAGQCASITDVWASQSCNPVASVGSIPHDHVILLYSTPILAQIILKGVSAEALTVCWSIIVVFVLYSIIYVNGWLQMWTVLYVIIFINISSEVERLNRVSFLFNQESMAVDEEKIRSLRAQQESDAELMSIRTKHQAEIYEMKVENEVKLRETESEQLRSLMGNVAHDLKTPLHSIEADLEVLFTFISKIPKNLVDVVVSDFQTGNSRYNCDPQSVFDSLTATCQFMAMAINRSQDFMKASNNIALVPAMETFDLKVAVDMSVTCINHLQVDRTIIFHPMKEDLCTHVISDKHWMSENVLCLLSNALKYSDGGVVDVRVKLTTINALRNEPFMSKNARMRSKRRISWTPHDSELDPSSLKSEQDGTEFVLVTVEDNGIGISEEASLTLFQPFKQVQRMAGGTGLGLFSLLKRVEALEGMCGVGSRTDGKEGCTFWFTFPYRPDHQASEMEAPTQNPLLHPERSASEKTEDPIHPRRILLVDDSLSILKVVSRLLKMNGHIVDTASNGLLGLEKLKKNFGENVYDMVLTDLQMPVMDGMEATDRYRKFEGEENVKSEYVEKKLLIVGMSANSDAQSKKDALATGMDYFFTKPFSYKDLQPILLLHQSDIESGLSHKCKKSEKSTTLSDMSDEEKSI